MSMTPPPGPPATPQPMPSAVPQAVPPQGTGTAASALFSGLNTADASKDGNWVRPGHYIMRMNTMKAGKSTKPGGGEFLASELTVLKVLGTAECIQAGTVAHSVGEQVVDMKSRKFDSFHSNVNGQLAGMEGMSFEALKADLARSNKTIEHLAAEAIGPGQPYAGRCFEVTARHVPTRARPVVNAQTGQPEMRAGVFTKITYVRPVPLAEVVKLMDDDEKTLCFPGNTLEQALAAEGVVEQAMSPATGSTVVEMAGVKYTVPSGWTTDPAHPGWGWDGTQWQSLTPA